MLIFSRNDTADAVALINDVYGIADEIVLVDSSDRKVHDGLLAWRKRLGLGKLRIFYTVPIGYPDPLRMWALKKCRYGWVLLLDTDEKLSDYGKESIKEFISNTDASAFAIRRYEDYTGKSRGAFFTWQIRLFRRDDVRFRGIVHEQAEVDGVVERAQENFYIGHFASLRGRSSAEYSKMEMFDRMSYEIAKRRLVEYFNKVVIPREGKISERPSGKILEGLLDAYRRVRLKGKDDELADLDYLLFFAAVDIGYRIKDRRLAGMLRIYHDRKNYIRRIKEGSDKNQKEVFEISKRINDTGIIAYLGLDCERTIKRLNKKYASGPMGTDLLIKLLKLRYEKGRKWLD